MHTSSSNFIFLDIETLPAEDDNPIWKNLSGGITQNPGESTEDFAERFRTIQKNTAMLPSMGRVWMAGVAFRNEEPIIFSGDGSPAAEKIVLQSLTSYLKSYSTPWLVGYNVAGFDIPFLQVRALHHNMPALAKCFGKVSDKPWDQKVIDLMKVFPRTGADKSAYEWGLKGVGKMDTVCQVLGIQRQTGVMGPEVADAYLRRDVAGVEEHLRQDIIQTREIFKKVYTIL